MENFKSALKLDKHHTENRKKEQEHTDSPDSKDNVHLQVKNRKELSHQSSLIGDPTKHNSSSHQHRHHQPLITFEITYTEILAKEDTVVSNR